MATIAVCQLEGPGKIADAAMDRRGCQRPLRDERALVGLALTAANWTALRKGEQKV